MRQSQLFTKTRKDAPKDEVSKNAELLIRAGYIHKEMAGVYSFLPLGLRVLNNIVEIIREEMNALGGQEISMTALQNKEVWEKSGRWSDDVLDVWFKTELKNKTEIGLGTTHEEPLTAIMQGFIKSYRDLPKYAYQFQTKFRNETRAKSGIMRAREFLMKDLYSFSRTQEQHDEFYQKAKESYIRIFKTVGLGEKTFFTYASGGSFSKYSHEFQTECFAGEDLVYVDEKSKVAINKEVLNEEVLKDVGFSRNDLVEKKTVEVGNIFNLGTRFSEAFGLNFLDENGEKRPVIMGSYGIGPGRLMGTIVEVFADDKGLVWPKNVAPFKLHLISLAGEDEKVRGEADALYEKLAIAGIESLYDDRDARAGEKFADADLIGIPWRAVISAKTIEKGIIELKNRATGEVSEITTDDLIKKLK